tara:strand:- start:336 stop:590 length:255 start_codon:yes stop_codon:yes gene_type:complete
MAYHPQTFTISAPQIVRGLFDSQSSESLLLEKAACGNIRLVAKPEEWNKILWLLVNSFKNPEGKSLILGSKLGEIKKSLPIEFR